MHAHVTGNWTCLGVQIGACTQIKSAVLHKLMGHEIGSLNNCIYMPHTYYLPVGSPAGSEFKAYAEIGYSTFLGLTRTMITQYSLA